MMKKVSIIINENAEAALRATSAAEKDNRLRFIKYLILHNPQLDALIVEADAQETFDKLMKAKRNLEKLSSGTQYHQ